MSGAESEVCCNVPVRELVKYQVQFLLPATCHTKLHATFSVNLLVRTRQHAISFM